MAWIREAQKPIYHALQHGDLDRFGRLLKEYPDNLRRKDGRECWLHEAVEEGRLPFVKLLVEDFGIHPDEVDSDLFHFPNTALSVAATKGHLEVVHWLLDHGATLNFEIAGETGCPALRSAATQGHLDVVQHLVERGAYLHHVLNGMNPVSLAEAYGHIDVAKYLRSKGAKHVCEITPPDYETGHKLVRESLTAERGPLGEWHADVPGDPAVRIHVIPPNEKRDRYTLFTLGLSDKNLPWTQWHLYQFQELRLMLPPDWPFTEAAQQNPQYNWPVEELKRLVVELRAGDDWPPEPMLFMHGDPPQPLGPETALCGWLCLRSMRGDGVDLPDHRCVEWNDLFAIYAEEADYARQHGHEALAMRFEERDIPLYVDTHRENVGL